MSRTLPAALASAIVATGYQPDLKLELADINPHFATLAGSGATGPCAAAVAPDGSVIAAYLALGAPNQILTSRVTDPSSAAQWGATAVRSSDARGTVAPCLVVSGSTVRLIWQAAATLNVLYCDSTDSGQTWSAPATLFSPGHVCYGVAGDQDLTKVFIAYDPGSTFIRVAAWTNSAGWTGSDWTNGDLNTITGIVAARQSAGVWGLVLSLQTATGEAYSIQSCVYTAAGPSWTALALVVPIDTQAGFLVAYPHLAQFDGLYQLSYQVRDTGSSSGVVYTRVARARSIDFVHWESGLEDGQSYAYGAAWCKHSTCYLLVGPEGIRRAPVYSAGSNYRDMSADLLKLDLVEREGHPARATITLDNSTGVYNALPALVRNAQILLSQGAAGVAMVPTHLLYVDEWTFVRAAESNDLVIVASDGGAFLERQVRLPLGYANVSVGYVASDLAARAGLVWAAALVDGATQFIQVYTALLLHAGTTYAHELDRSLATFLATWKVELVAGAGIAFPVVERLHVFAKAAGQAIAWTYADDPDTYAVTYSGDRANHVAVYGSPTVPSAYAEAWDFADVNAVGQERFALAVESLAGNASLAGIRATLELAAEQRLAIAVRATLQPNPALELLDAVAINDSTGNVQTRITGLHLQYDAQHAHHDLILTGEGV